MTRRTGFIAIGMLAGIAPALAGIVTVLWLIDCEAHLPGSFTRVQCDEIQSFYVTLAAAVALVGAFAGGCAGRWAARRSRR